MPSDASLSGLSRHTVSFSSRAKRMTQVSPNAAPRGSLYIHVVRRLGQLSREAHPHTLLPFASGGRMTFFSCGSNEAITNRALFTLAKIRERATATNAPEIVDGAEIGGWRKLS
eukprot:565433-Prymnesium_polylepis.1